MTFLRLMNWTILVTLVSSGTSYLFMKYGTVKKIVLNLTDLSESDIQRIRGWIRWKF